MKQNVIEIFDVISMFSFTSPFHCLFHFLFRLKDIYFEGKFLIINVPFLKEQKVTCMLINNRSGGLSDDVIDGICDARGVLVKLSSSPQRWKKASTFLERDLCDVVW